MIRYQALLSLLSLLLISLPTAAHPGHAHLHSDTLFNVFLISSLTASSALALLSYFKAHQRKHSTATIETQEASH